MQTLQLTKNNFSQEVLKAREPVLIDFWAPWCGPCRMVSPIVEELAQEAKGRYKVAKVNIEEQPELASAFQVMSIPTLVVMKEGKPAGAAVGVRSKAAILAMLDA